jgi:hypothetical protein
MSNRRTISGAALCLVVVFLSYVPLLSIPLIADDYYFYSDGVARHPFCFFARNLFPEGLDAYFLRPVPVLLYAAESLFERWFPILPHLTNIFLHLATVVLVGLLIGCPSRSSSRPKWPAVIAGMLFFGVHPQNTGAVCWVSARFDIFACLFGALGVYAWLRHSEKPAERFWRVTAVGGFCMALLSKETAVVFPLAVILWELAERMGGSQRFGAVKCRTRPLILIIVLYAVYRYGVLGGLGGYTGLSFLSPHLSPVLGFGLAVLWPFSHKIPPLFYPLAILSLGAVAMTFLRRREQDDTGSRFPWLLPGMLCLLSLACAIILPCSVLKLLRYASEGRFSYTSVFACSILIGWVIRKYLPPSRYKIMVLPMAVIFVFLVWAQQIEIHRWHEAGDRAQSILDQTTALVPRVRPGTVLIFRRIPIESEQGCAVMGMGLFEVLQKRYHEKDIRVIQWATKDMLNHPPKGSYIFLYHYKENKLVLEKHTL